MLGLPTQMPGRQTGASQPSKAHGKQLLKWRSILLPCKLAIRRHTTQRNHTTWVNPGSILMKLRSQNKHTSASRGWTESPIPHSETLTPAARSLNRIEPTHTPTERKSKWTTSCPTSGNPIQRLQSLMCCCTSQGAKGRFSCSKAS